MHGGSIPGCLPVKSQFWLHDACLRKRPGSRTGDFLYTRHPATIRGQTLLLGAHAQGIGIKRYLTRSDIMHAPDDPDPARVNQFF